MKRPVCLAIGGSDTCGGAGIQADLRMFDMLKAQGCSALTALTAQNPREIIRMDPVPLAQLDAEMQAVFDYYDVAVVKTGMLVDAEHVAVVAAALQQYHAGKPVVIDPVMVASSGAVLLDEGGRDALLSALVSQASLLTPNLDEAAYWLGRTIGHAKEDARILAGRFQCAVLLKGGHGEGKVLSDVLAMPDGSVTSFEHALKAWSEEQRHGTGCRLAAAIAAYLALGEALEGAVSKGIASARQYT